MARVPTTTEVGERQPGTIRSRLAPRSEAPVGDFGQAAARAMGNDRIGQALAGFGQQVDRAGGLLTENIVRDQEIQNDTEATATITDLSGRLNTLQREFTERQGVDATSAFPDYSERVRIELRNALESASNPRVRRMLEGRAALMAENAGNAMATWNSRQTREANAQAQQGSAEQAIAAGVAAANDPAGLATALNTGTASIANLGALNGWPPERVAQMQAQYRGRFYAAVIETVLDRDPLAARRMFDTIRGDIDAASQVSIANRLENPVRSATNAERLQTITGPIANPDSPGGIADRVWRIEGGERANPNPGQTARGGGITDGTWAAYAPRLGLTPEQRGTREGFNRVFAAYQEDFRRALGREPTAGEQYAAWFLGIGGARAFIMASPDTDARQLYGQVAGERLANQAFAVNGEMLRPGMTTGQVLAEVNRRFGQTAQRPSNSEIVRRAVEAAGPDVRDQTDMYAQANRWISMRDAAEQQERVGLQRRIEDTQRALEAGAPNITIPEPEIRRLYQPEEADRILDGLYTAQVAGQVLTAVQMQSPAEIQATITDVTEGNGPVTRMLRERRGIRQEASGNVLEEDAAADAAMRTDLRAALDRAVVRRNEELRANPARYALRDPAVARAAQAAADPQAGPDAMAAYVAATRAAQARLGIPAYEQRVLDKQVAQRIAGDLMASDPGDGSRQNPDGPVIRLRALRQQYGEAWPDVFRDLVRDGRLPEEYQVLSNIATPVGQADYARVIAAARQAGGFDKLDNALAPDVRTSINRDVESYVRAFTRTATASGQSGGGPLAAMVQGAVRNLAVYYALGGASATDALRRATDRIINDRYEIEGTMRVPRTTSDGRPLGLAPVQRSLAGVMDGLRADSIVDTAGDPALTPERRREIVLGQARRGQWVPNETDTGLVLMYEIDNGGRLPLYVREGTPNSVRDRNGQFRVEIRFDNLPEPGARSPAVRLPDRVVPQRGPGPGGNALQ